MTQPVEGVPLYAFDFPARSRVVDVQRRLRERGYVLAWSNGQIYAVRAH